MRTRLLALAAAGGILAVGALTGAAQAGAVNVTLGGAGVSGTVVLTYGPATDAKYPNAYEVTGIGGTFSDANIGIVDAPVLSLVAINHATPEPTNLLAPADFSRFGPIMNLPPDGHGFLTYDNLYWPDGSSQTASDYPPHGGVLDIYGLMFTIAGGDVVDVWSNGVFGPGGADYGVAVANSVTGLDYVGSGVTATLPEAGSLSLLASGLVGLLLRRRRGAAPA